MDHTKSSDRELPTGIITALFTDIVDSTMLKGLMNGRTSARRDARFRETIKAPHDKIVLACVDKAGGHKVTSTGDGYCFAFADPEEAVLCALEVQQGLHANPIQTPLGCLLVR